MNAGLLWFGHTLAPPLHRVAGLQAVAFASVVCAPGEAEATRRFLSRVEGSQRVSAGVRMGLETLRRSVRRRTHRSDGAVHLHWSLVNEWTHEYLKLISEILNLNEVLTRVRWVSALVCIFIISAQVLVFCLSISVWSEFRVCDDITGTSPWQHIHSRISTSSQVTNEHKWIFHS